MINEAAREHAREEISFVCCLLACTAAMSKSRHAAVPVTLRAAAAVRDGKRRFSVFRHFCFAETCIVKRSLYGFLIDSEGAFNGA